MSLCPLIFLEPSGVVFQEGQLIFVLLKHSEQDYVGKQGHGQGQFDKGHKHTFHIKRF